jgi:ABC-type multidrug transport system fused ATPase/permease subunit
MAATKVVVLDETSIVEEGVPADLMARQGPFARLFSGEHASRLGAAVGN